MSNLAPAETFSDLGFFELDRLGNVRVLSADASRLMGISADDLVPPSNGEATTPPHDPLAASSLESAARQGRSESTGWLARRDGSKFWANVVTLPIKDAAGLTTGFARVVRDITPWKSAEEERDRMFKLSADLICVAGFDGFFKRVNPSFTRVLGYSQTELMDKPFLSFVNGDDVAATQKELLALQSGQPVLSFQNRYRHVDGSLRWLEWKCVPVVEDGLIYAIARDISDQKSIEQKMREYAAELERSNSELQQFAYVASHDLQEPLRAVAGCVQMIAERNAGKLDERSLELMGHAVDGAKRLQALINDLLAFSRVGSKGISKAWIDPHMAATKAVRQLRVAIGESGAQVTIDALPHVFADPVQLTQLFQNLIGNAIKFRTNGPPTVHIQAEQHPGETIFWVKDNGIGIAPEYHSRLFGVFQRLHPRREYSGTGIGLAICKKIVERHGGRIWVDSNVGMGATFYFSIPKDSR